MTLPFATYPELTVHTAFEAYYEDSPVFKTELEISPDTLFQDEPSPNLMRSFQQTRPYSTEPSYIAPYVPSNQNFACDEVAPVMWGFVGEPEVYLNTPEVHPFPPTELAFTPETFSNGTHSHVQYPPEHTYTRMFRGRKSKSAAEVLDELRPYACDICQAAFARSHDRDRHKRSHTGETPYRCHGCGTGFKRPDARKRHWERDPMCAQEDWLRVRHTPEGAKRRARAKTKPSKKQAD